MTRLYNHDRWLNREYIFVEVDTGSPVEFIMSVDFDENAEVIEFFDVMKDRPNHVRLRGPYS